MGTVPPGRLLANREEDRLRRLAEGRMKGRTETTLRELAEDLRTETLPVIILQRLAALRDSADRCGRTGVPALMFLQAGGLPSLVRLLRGTTSSHNNPDAGSTSCTISEAAGQALTSLFSCTADYHKPFFTELIPAMISALRDAPASTARVAAARALAMVAHNDPASRKAIAEAGAIGLVLSFFLDVGESSWDEDVMGPVWELARMLLRSEKAARRDLKRAIGTADADKNFIAINIVRDSVVENGAEVMAAVEEAGFPNALVAALKHESPACASAAAGALSGIGQNPGGYRLLVGCGAIPALVSAIKTARPSAEPEKLKRFSSGGNFRFHVHGRPTGTEGIPFNNPTAVAVGVICAVNLNGPLLDSFLSSGGIPGVVRLLSKSTCPEVIDNTACFIGRLLDPENFLPEKPTRSSRELADKLFQAGLCKAAVQALKRQLKGTHRSLLNMVFMLFETLSPHFRLEALAPLLAGGLVEFTVAHMAKAGADELECALGLFKACLMLPDGCEGMCAPGTVEQLMKWIGRWLLEADWPVLVDLPALLLKLLDLNTRCVRAAFDANVFPGLVRSLRDTRKRVELDPQGVVDIRRGLAAPLECLKRLLWQDMNDTRRLWEPAVNAGLPAQLQDCLLRLRDEATVSSVMAVTQSLMIIAPRGELSQWGGGLVRGIAEALTATPPVAAKDAVEILHNFSVIFPELTADADTWGIEDALQKLTMDSDVRTMIEARSLQDQLFSAREYVNGVRQFAFNPIHLSDLRQGTVCSNQHDLSHPAPGPTAAGTLQPNGRGPHLGRKKKTAAQKAGPKKAEPHEEQPSVALRPQSPSDGVSDAGHGREGRGEQGPTDRVSPEGCNPARRAVRKVWACGRCGKTPEALGIAKLRECSGCKSVRYCGKVCQQADWPAHKPICKRLQSAPQ